MKLGNSIKSPTFILWIFVKIVLFTVSIYKLPSMISITYQSNFDLTALTITFWLVYCALSCTGILRSKVLLISGLLIQLCLAIAVFVLYQVYAFSDFGLYSGLLMLVFGWWLHFIGQKSYEDDFRQFTKTSFSKDDVVSFFYNFDSSVETLLENDRFLNGLIFVLWIMTKIILILGSVYLILISFVFLYLLIVPFYGIFFLWHFFNLICSLGILRWKTMAIFGLAFQASLIYFFAKFSASIKISQPDYGVYKFLAFCFLIWWLHFIGQFCYQKYWKER